MRPLASPLIALALAGCDDVGGIADKLGVRAPSAELLQVDLLDAPSANQMLAWSCYEYLGDDLACQLAGYDDQPSDDKMKFTFDIVFDMTNENDSIPIPLIETLLGVTAFDTTELGTICVSYCDPDDADCTPSINAEGACIIDDETTEVDEADDLIPTVDELIELATDVAAGDVDNGVYRVIPAGESIQTHLLFDLAPTSMMDLGESLLMKALEDAIAGDEVVLDVPYTMRGTLFFDVPDMGRHAIGFGPIDDVWEIE